MPHETGSCKLTLPEASQPHPSRAKRRQASTKEMENLYYRHAARDSAPSGRQSSTFPSGPSRSTAKDQHAVPSGSGESVPLSKAVLEGDVPQSQGKPRPVPFTSAFDREGAMDVRSLPARPEKRQTKERFTMRRNDPIDARSLGARPESSPEERFTMKRTDPINPRNLSARPEDSNGERFTSKRTGPIDARNMGARPESSHGEIRNGIANQVTRRPTDDTIGLEVKQRFPPRQSPSGQDDYQNRRSRPEVDFTPRQIGSANNRSRPPQSSRSGGGNEPRRRRRDKQASVGNDFGNSKPFNEIWNEEEDEYRKEKQKREAAKSLNYQPTDVSRETLSGVAPAVVSGKWGMSELLGERLTLAKKYREGEYIEWQSKEQKAEVMTLVDRLKNIDKKISDEQMKAELLSPSTETESQTQRLLQKLLGGNYEFTKPQPGKDILGNVARHIDKNESYFADDQRSLLDKVKSLMPTDKGTRNGERAKSEARA